MKKVAIITVLVLLLSFTLMACSPKIDDTGTNHGTSEDKEEHVEGNNETNNGDSGSQDEDVNKDEDDDNNVEEDDENVEETLPIIKYDTILIASAKAVNIRSGMGSSYSVEGTLRHGEGVAMISRENSKWYKIHYKGKHAYISSSYVREVSIPKSNNEAVEKVIEVGKTLMGYPYVWGSQRYHFGNGILNRKFEMGKFDCSALTQYAMYKGAKVIIDVTTRSQVVQGKVVRDEIRRGDLMFFTNSARRRKKGIERVGHVAIYLGDNHILHTADDYAVIEEISSSRWKNYLVSKRYL